MKQEPTSTSDLSAEPFFSQLSSFGYIYWLANWMELVERFAYYGVRVVLPVFMVAAIEENGPELTQIQKGTIYSVWAIVQSFVPILSGGFADRYGYKINIALSTILKIVGYLIMGYTVWLAEYWAGSSLRVARNAGADVAYEIFFVGALFLALGTAIFKPGVQGLIANQMPKTAASLGWGLFYQMVNIGGFIGPLLAGYLRAWKWEYVFIACSVGIALNFIPLALFKEPDSEGKKDITPPPVLLYRAMCGLLEPRLFFFTISFAGFWLMAYQFFDILPNFIDDWIDSRGVATSLIKLFGVNGEHIVPVVNGGNLPQEWLINANALLISLLAFAVGFVSGKLRSLNAIIVGIGISAAAIVALGMSMNGWWILAAIALFSLGEMMASPTKMRYIAGIAPAGKEGLYMGYVNFTVGIGWSIGSILAGYMYEAQGDKVNLARKYLVEEAGVVEDAAAALNKSEVLPFFEEQLGVNAWEARTLLWDTYEPYSMWVVFAFIGIGSMAGIAIYDRVVRAADANPHHSFNRYGKRWVLGFLVPICLSFAVLSYFYPSPGLILNGLFFGIMLLISLVSQRADSGDMNDLANARQEF